MEDWIIGLFLLRAVRRDLTSPMKLILRASLGGLLYCIVLNSCIGVLLEPQHLKTKDLSSLEICISLFRKWLLPQLVNTNRKNHKKRPSSARFYFRCTVLLQDDRQIGPSPGRKKESIEILLFWPPSLPLNGCYTSVPLRVPEYNRLGEQ